MSPFISYKSCFLSIRDLSFRDGKPKKRFMDVVMGDMKVVVVSED